MRSLIILTTTLLTTTAQAHTGHLAQSGGHSHWFGAAAILAALALAAVQATRSAKRARAES